MTDRNDPFDDLERMFDVMSRQLGGGVGDPFGGDVPVDLRETGDGYVLVADLPGYDPAAIDLTISDGQRVSLSASRERETETADGQFITHERHHETVSRTITLPEPVDEDATEAAYDAGVLTVRLPKREADEGGTDIPVN